jgi:hypothetical protein
MFPTTLYKPEVHEEKTVTTRPPASAFLLINSRDRYYLNTPNGSVLQEDDGTIPLNNFVLNTGQQLSEGHFTRLAVTEVSMPWNIPNVNPYNNTLTLSTVSGIYTATIPTGFYNIVQLGSAVQSTLNGQFPLGGGDSWKIEPNIEVLANPSSYTAFDNEQNFVFSNTCNATSPISFSIVPTPDVNKGAIGKGKNMDLRRMMGFVGIDQFGVPFTTFNEAFVGNYNSLQYTTYVDIRSRRLTNYQNVRDNESAFYYNNVIHRMIVDNNDSGKLRPLVWNSTLDASGNPITNPNQYTGNAMYWTGPFNMYSEVRVPKYIKWSPDVFVSEADFSLYDDAGNLLYMPPGHPDYLLTLHVTEA